MDDNAELNASFARDIEPLFRDQDQACMIRFGIDLRSYDFMSDPTGAGPYPDHANARMVYARLLPGAGSGRMPKHGPYWSDAQIALYRRWMDEGFNP